MKAIGLSIELIIQKLSEYIGKDIDNINYNVVTFFDKKYPSSLLPYIYQIPIIYYRGDIECLSRCSAIMVTHSPSYYAQKIIKQIRVTESVIALKSNANSITKESSLCDIIYCNDVCELQKNQAPLTFSIGEQLSNVYQLQLISQMIDTLYVIEGYPNVSSFDFIAQSIDNQVEIKALPTNIYLSGSRLPNILLSQGVTPLLLN